MASQTETEFSEFDANNIWNDVYQRLKNESSLATLGDQYSTKLAREPDNRRKNRYRDVSPYDHSRVKLSGDTDYINASFIEVPQANRRYILTQGPLEHTMCDFWQMTWEQNSKAIVMLNRTVEKGSLKCSQYWPLGADYGYEQEMFFQECGLRVTLVTEQDFQHFTLRTLQLENLTSGERRDVLHFHYTTWPDFGVPSSPVAFLHFLHSVRETGSLESGVGPAIVHCSAGIGRSGTFCLVDSCLIMVEMSGSLKAVNVRKLLTEMRSYRMGLIQTADQLRFSYLAIIEGAHAILSGNGLGNLQVSTLPWIENHIEGQSTPSPVKMAVNPTKSEKSDRPEHQLVGGEEPPPIPPKKCPIMRQSGLTDWGGTREIRPGGTWGEDDDSDGFDDLIDRNEDDGLDDSIDSEDELRMAELKHQIRQDRKKETVEKIQQMKERQQKSERCRPCASYAHHSMYLGVAIVVGVVAIVTYKYYW